MTNLSFHPTYGRLLQTRARLSLPEEIGVALRTYRCRLGLSQRAYTAARGYSRSMYARLESDSGGSRLDDVLRALEGTGFTLCLGPAVPEDPDADFIDLFEDEPQASDWPAP